MYANGQGVPRDHARAYLWLSVALSAGGGFDREPRDVVARSLSPAARADVDRLTTACRLSAFKACGEP
jgi:hypothetical protein